MFLWSQSFLKLHGLPFFPPPYAAAHHPSNNGSTFCHSKLLCFVKKPNRLCLRGHTLVRLLWLSIIVLRFSKLSTYMNTNSFLLLSSIPLTEYDTAYLFSHSCKFCVFPSLLLHIKCYEHSFTCLWLDIHSLFLWLNT